MSKLRQFIERVLAKRLSQHPKLEAVQRYLRELGEQLGQLRRLANQVSTSDDAPVDLRQCCAKMASEIERLDGHLAEVAAKVANLLARFAKKTINIGVAGKARQGKSTILQAISGLGSQVIPTSDGLPCTGAKSRILHRNDSPYAEVEFYTETEFLRDIVHAYYEELRFTPLPSTLDEFELALPTKPSFEKPEDHAVYDKLKELHGSLANYRPFLSRPVQGIGLDEVRDYVSQEEGRKRYVAVRCANIHVTFPNGDVTGLAIIDLPGLGEIAKGHSEKLVTSLQREVDAIILVKRPSAGGDDWFTPDMKVFNEIKRAVPELELGEWLFVVLNADRQNAKQVEILKERPPQIGSSPRLLAVNALDPDAVREEVFIEVLRYLEQNLEKIDQRQLTALAGQFANLAATVFSILEPIREYLQHDTIGTGDFEKFGKLFKSFRKDLRTSLDNLTHEYRLAVREGSKVREFGAAVNEACEQAKKLVPLPAADDLNERFHDLGGWPAVVQEELHHLRSFLTHCLAEFLDRKLAEMVHEVRRKVMSSIVAGPLGRVLPQDQDGSHPEQQLESLLELLDPASQPSLTSGLDYLLAFTFSYQSHFHHRVREAMNPLDPMADREEGEDEPISAICPRNNDAQRGEEVARGLRSFYDRVVWSVRKRLHEEMESDPMRALFSVVEETRDRLSRARDVEVQWQRLLHQRRGEIWPKEFNLFAVESARRQELQEAIDTMSRIFEKLRSALA